MTDLDAAPPQDFDPNDPTLFVEPPKWPKVVGILSIVFGGISVFCGGLGLASLSFGASMAQGQIGSDPLPPNMVLSPIEMAGQGLGMLVTIVLIVAGVMLVTRKPAAKAAHLVYAVLMLPAAVLGVWIQTQEKAAMDQYAQQYDNVYAQQHAQAGPAGIIVAIVLTVLFLGWPAFCFVWFGLVKTKPTDMTGQAPPDGAPSA